MTRFERVIADEEFTLKNIPIINYQHSGYDVFHECKSNHEVSVSFKVLDPNKKISFYHMTTDGFEKYAFQANAIGSDLEPRTYIFQLKKVSGYDNYKIPIVQSTRLHFIFAKSGAFVPIKLTIVESWESDNNTVGVLPGIPIMDNRLSKRIKQLIHESTTSLKIISPHTDLHLIEDISDAVKRGVDVKLIIRNEDHQNTAVTKQAFPRLQRVLGKNLKSNDKIHSRLIIRDTANAIVMSSDMEQNSLQNLINCGVEVFDSFPIGELNHFFDEIWRQSKNTN